MQAPGSHPRCAYTAQVPRLFSDSLRDNIPMGLDRSEDDIMAAIRTAVMDYDVGEFDEGLETKVGPKGVKLSGGQIQRTAAARCSSVTPSSWSSMTSRAHWMSRLSRRSGNGSLSAPV